MPGSSRKTPVWLPILVLLIAMSSIQSGASLAKSLFPLVGAPGVTALRLALGTLSSRRPVDFIWVVLAVLGLWFLLPLGQDVSHVDLFGAAMALGAGACWAIYILSGQRAGAEHGPATVAVGSLIAALVFVPLGVAQAGEALWHWSVIPLGLAVAVLSTALPYSLEMIALTRLPTRTFGTLMSMEPALAAVAGILFLGETLTPVQLLALGAIIAASMGSTLTIRRESKIKEVDVN